MTTIRIAGVKGYVSNGTPNVVAMRDKIAKRFGFWTGNYVVKVLRPLFK